MTFDEWWTEIENFSMRCERFECSEIEASQIWHNATEVRDDYWREKLTSEDFLCKFMDALYCYKGFAPDVGKVEIKAALTKLIESI